MANEFVRSIKNIKDIQKQEITYSNQNDLFSDGKDVYVLNNGEMEKITLHRDFGLKKGENNFKKVIRNGKILNSGIRWNIQKWGNVVTFTSESVESDLFLKINTPFLKDTDTIGKLSSSYKGYIPIVFGSKKKDNDNNVFYEHISGYAVLQQSGLTFGNFFGGLTIEKGSFICCHFTIVIED